jgi:CheY-like chemotaxis protein
MNSLTKVLIVEDNPGDIMLIRDALEDEETIDVIDVTTNGEQAIRYLKQLGEFESKSKPNLVILDINLPRVNGHEVLHFIKNNENTKETPVVMLSSSSSDTDIQASYKKHANCYITKPVGLDNFTDVIHDIRDFWLNLVKLPDRRYSSHS